MGLLFHYCPPSSPPLSLSLSLSLYLPTYLPACLSMFVYLSLHINLLGHARIQEFLSWGWCPGPNARKQLRQRFYPFFVLVLNLFYSSAEGVQLLFKENYNFTRFQRGGGGGGSSIFQAVGVQLFTGGSKC